MYSCLLQICKLTNGPAAICQPRLAPFPRGSSRICPEVHTKKSITYFTYKTTFCEQKPRAGAICGQPGQAWTLDWSANLADRCVLEPAIAAVLWEECDKRAGQDVLVWREKRRDGGPGAKRRRLLKPIINSGKWQVKVRWQFRGQKTDEPFYTLGSLDDLKAAIANSGGFVHIVDGEVDFLVAAEPR